MNTLQAIQLEMLRSFMDVCERLGLRYYLVCGSALGAAKYGGFIPWDDDVDVAMPRGDYEIFCDQAQKLLPGHIFLQNYLTDKSFPAIYTKLRHNDTTFMETASAHLPIHHGVYMDVFPLDGYPEKKWAQQWLECRKTVCKLLLMSAFRGSYSRKVRLLMGCFRLFGVHRHTARVAQYYERVIASYAPETGTLWCNHGNWQNKLEYAPKVQYGQGCWAHFEGLQVRIPEQYDAYLTRKYGHWRADLPQAQQRSHHAVAVCDCHRPYTAYTVGAGEAAV